MKLFSFLTTSILTFVFSLVVFLSNPLIVHAQTSIPVVGVSPSSTVQVGSQNNIQLYLVNMGVPLKKVEITVRLVGGPWPKSGIGFNPPTRDQYGLKYVSHTMSDFSGRNDIRDFFITFEATNSQGYNQGSSQIPLATLSYTVEPGIFSAAVIPESTRLTQTDGQLVPNILTYPTSNYTSSVPSDWPDLQTYSLSFESGIIRKWWPTAPNSVQQIDAAVWKDSDGTNVKKFTNLQAEWQVDPDYFEITNTSSSYFDACPVPTVGSNRACIRFAAHVMTKKPGNTSVRLNVTDPITGHQVWNSYVAEIYSISTPTPNATPPIVVITPSSIPTRIPPPAFYPEGKVSTKEFQDVQQKVTYLQNQLDQQQQQLSNTQGLLDRIVNFLKKLFHFS